MAPVSNYISPKAVKGRPSAIGGRDWQRPELQRTYRDYFSTYLLRRIAGGTAQNTTWRRSREGA